MFLYFQAHGDVEALGKYTIYLAKNIREAVLVSNIIRFLFLTVPRATHEELRLLQHESLSAYSLQ